jgi:HSP20 family molecular chaperone IbpA
MNFKAFIGLSSGIIAAAIALKRITAEELQADACAAQSKRNTLPIQRSSSPWDLIRDVDDLLDQQWTSGFGDLYSYRPRLLNSLLERPFLDHFHPRLIGTDEVSGVRLATPRYEINEDDNEFKLAVDVPGVKPGDMKIKLEQDGRVLRLTGERKIQDGNWKSEMKFEKAFLLDKKIQSDKITANFSDGVVVITAPKVPLIEPKKDIEIPITEFSRASFSKGENDVNKV